MHLKLIEIIYIFTLFSVAGWMIEFVYRSVSERRFVNPGLLAGPYLPIYGFGALLLTVVRPHLSEHHFLFVTFAILSYFPAYQELNLLQPLLLACHIVAKGIFYMITATLLEFASGWSLERFFKVRLWSYEDQNWSIRGYICLKFSLFWVFLAFTLEYFLLPAAMKFYQSGAMHATMISLALFEIMTADFLIRAARLATVGRPKRQNEAMDREREFLAIIEPLMQHRLVSSLENYRHHYLRTRLDHSLDVAWLSFQIAGKLHLDKKLTARGALLHDLFHYDWLREGPRWHGFRHPRIALENARKVIPLTKKEENIIIRHMWPLTPIPPFYPEAWVVSMVDKYCGTKDYVLGVAATLKKAIPDRIVSFFR